MSFTYPTSALSTSPLAQVRLLLGDTSSSQFELHDAEIDYFTDTYPNSVLAAAHAAEAIAAKYARQVDGTKSELSISASQRFKQYSERSEQLFRRSRTLAGISVGGRSREAKRERARDEDFVKPFFERGAFDFPGSLRSAEETSS